MARGDRRAGQFAHERFKARHRAWLKRVWWVMPLLIAFETAFITGVGMLTPWFGVEVWASFGLGIGIGMAAALLDQPPHHIERWRQGAEGERETAKVLKRLVKQGWTLVHDVPRERGGNIDHVLVGPTGVYLLETKNLHGELSVSRGVLTVRWREDPEDGYTNDRILRTVKGASKELSQRLAAAGAGRCWVQPVVVLNGRFEQRTRDQEGVGWVATSALAERIAKRDVLLSADEVRRVSEALRRLTAGEPAAAVLPGSHVPLVPAGS